MLACDTDDGANSGTDAWDPDTESGATGESGAPTTSTPTGPSSTSTADTDADPSNDSTTSDPDPTATDPSATAGGSTGDAGSESTGDSPPAGCSPDALTLIDLLNEYRAENALGPIPASSSLCTVGDLHVQDLATEAPHSAAECNLHSWSDAGPWSGCCYTSDHAAAQCMWDKPRELTAYPGNGYENAAGGGGALGPAEALELWKGSAGHNAVMLNEGTWANLTWNAVGVGISDGYAVLWFGEESDPTP